MCVGLESYLAHSCELVSSKFIIFDCCRELIVVEAQTSVRNEVDLVHTSFNIPVSIGDGLGGT